MIMKKSSLYDHGNEEVVIETILFLWKKKSPIDNFFYYHEEKYLLIKFYNFSIFLLMMADYLNFFF